MSDTKPTNPKDAFGSAKNPEGLVPDTATSEMALAFLEGALKYGRYNWRVAGVRASIYNDAIERHRKKWWNGQDRDPVTKVRDLASIMACCAILIDAEIVDMLTDDRPPRADLNKLLDDSMATVAHLKTLFAGHTPEQYTEAGQNAKTYGTHRVALAAALRPVVPAETTTAGQYEADPVADKCPVYAPAVVDPLPGVTRRARCPGEKHDFRLQHSGDFLCERCPAVRSSTAERRV